MPLSYACLAASLISSLRDKRFGGLLIRWRGHETRCVELIIIYTCINHTQGYPLYHLAPVYAYFQNCHHLFPSLLSFCTTSSRPIILQKYTGTPATTNVTTMSV